ncbi:hypothetical protein V1506DRAFT_528500 [Lipomyces tetrasporus]
MPIFHCDYAIFVMVLSVNPDVVCFFFLWSGFFSFLWSWFRFFVFFRFVIVLPSFAFCSLGLLLSWLRWLSAGSPFPLCYLPCLPCLA